jgi:hypothetical protein
VNGLPLFARFLALCGLVFLCDCSEREVVGELRSLSGSEDAVFLCRDEAGVGHPYSDCPDRNSADDAQPSKKLSVFALVSQTVTDEVAVVDVTGGRVIDVDPVRPGFGFLRVGGRPVSMAATPGGRATFVATSDVGRNGIFALPTSCLGAPKAHEPERDLTTWPACRLDETPGEISVMIEPFGPDATDGCRADGYGDDALGDNTCQGDLRDEAGGEGRRKLVIALPDSGQLVVIDAQHLLDTPAGTFPPCEIEARLDLKVEIPAGVAQTLPADLTGNRLEPGTTCSEVMAPMAPVPGMQPPQPAGFALADSRLYVADQAAPVVHVVDTTSVCGMRELAPLLPMSLREPGRVVTTRRVAVSPLTPAGQRFVYAIDAEDQPGASVMAFDVSPGATDRTPLVRSGSPELAGERPDRLALGSSARDVTFAYRDIPYVDPATGVGQFGTRCDPDPSIDPTSSPAALARSSADFTSGARPGLLRGLFGFILLTNGSIAVVDVDDFDADCRRPVTVNPDAVPDFRGCANDTLTGPLRDERTGRPLTTNEVSCRVVEPHRFRSSRLAINDPLVGVHAPSLSDLPQFSPPTAAAASAFSDRPRLLAVPFAESLSGTEVYIGSTRFSTDPRASDVVPVDPNNHDSEQLQTQHSLILPPLEPRAYAPSDTVTLTYEGPYVDERTSGVLSVDGDQGILADASLSFCGVGVYDVPTMKSYAQGELGVADAAAADTFATAHADYVQLTSALLAENDPYWQVKGAPKRSECLSQFGAEDADPLLKTRDFRVVSAFADKLLLESRLPKDAPPMALVKACFPTVQKYRLRTGDHWTLLHSSSGFKHDVVASGPSSRCVRSCDPLRKWGKSRVFEISSSAGDDAANPHCRGTTDPGDPLELRVGCARPVDVACVYDQVRSDPSMTSAVMPTDAAWACVFNGLNDRFALYRGRAESVRDSVFTWHTTGGFAPLVMSLSSLSNVVAPQSIQFLQQPEQMAVVDGASQGLSLFSLDTFSVVKPSPFY